MAKGWIHNYEYWIPVFKPYNVDEGNTEYAYGPMMDVPDELAEEFLKTEKAFLEASNKLEEYLDATNKNI